MNFYILPHLILSFKIVYFISTLKIKSKSNKGFISIYIIKEPLYSISFILIISNIAVANSCLE